MYKLIKCPLCGIENNKFHLFHEKLRCSYSAKVYKCTNCDFVFLHPKLSEAEQKQYYSEQYRIDYKDQFVELRYNIDMVEAKIRMKRILEKFNNAKSILEIGSGSGAFLSLADEQFSYAVGIELDINSQKFLKNKGINIFPNLESLGNKKYDIIVLFHVLEHLLDPVSFLKDLKKLLNKHGKIIIEVPNIDDALISFYNIDEFKNFYFCSAHVSYFSEKTLMNCIKQAGLIGKISQVQRYDLYNHLHWLKYRIPQNFLEQPNIFSKSTLKAYECDLISKKIGDTLWGVFH